MSLSPLSTHGTSFTDRDGMLLTYAGFSEFRLLDRFLRGEDITPIFDDRNAVLAEVREIAAKTGDGAWLFPVLRVFGMLHYITRLYPQDYSTYYTSIRALVDFAAEHGFYVQFECFADAQVVMPDVRQQRYHWVGVCDAFRGCHTVLLSLGNEAPKNGFKPEDFERPTLGYLCTRGSMLGDAPPFTPAWDFSCFHGRRGPGTLGIKGWQSGMDLAFMVVGNTEFRDPSDHYPGVHQPVIHDEPLGCGESFEPNRRSNQPFVFHGIGWDAAKWGAGGTFHSDCGIQSIPFTPTQRACAAAFVMGMAKMDPAQRFRG